MPPKITEIANDRIWVFSLTALFALAMGVANGDGNQVVYLIPGMHEANPAFLSGDWFATQVDHYHQAFNELVTLIAASGQFELGLAVGTVAQSVGLAVATWILARALYDDPLIPWALTMMLLAVTGTYGVGLTLLTVPQLEASAIAGVAMIFGLALLASERHTVWAGVAFGIAALFHAHFAVLLMPIVGIAALMVYRRTGLARALWLLLPFIALGVPSYMQVFDNIMYPAGAEADRISLLRFPHHTDPRTWGPLQGVLFAAILVIGAVGFAVRAPRRRTPFLIAVGTMAAVAGVSLLVGYGGLSRDLMILFPWRLSSMVILCAFLFASAAALQVPVGFRGLRTAVGAAALGAFAILALSVLEVLPLRVGIGAAAAVAVAAWVNWQRPPTTAPSIRRTAGRTRFVALSMIVLGFVPAVAHGLTRSQVSLNDRGDRNALYDWVRSHTDSEAVFAIPPSWGDFRLLAERAVVVDHKAAPPVGSDLLEWADRIRSVTGLEPTGEAAPLDAAFFAATCERIRRLHAEYDVRYVIRTLDVLPCGVPVYSDTSFAIVELGENIGASSPGGKWDLGSSWLAIAADQGVHSSSLLRSSGRLDPAADPNSAGDEGVNNFGRTFSLAK